jgi:hypothetical protein
VQPQPRACIFTFTDELNACRLEGPAEREVVCGRELGGARPQLGADGGDAERAFARQVFGALMDGRHLGRPDRGQRRGV